MAFLYAQEVIDYIHDLLDDNKEEIGLTAVLTSGEDELFFDLPAIVITDGETVRSLHGTQTFHEYVNLDLWIYHADINEDRRKRNREDRKMADDVVTLLHSNYTLGGNIVHGFVENETPGVLARASQTMVGTRISWQGRLLTPMLRS